MNSNYQEWHNTTSNYTEEIIALRIARWRILELPRNESQWILREGIKSLMKPSCRTSMKNSDKQRNKKKEKLKTQGESLQWFRWISVIIRAWNSRKERRALETKNLLIVNKLQKKRLTYGWNKNKNYIMLNLHRLNWWQTMDLAYYLLS